MTNKRQLSIKDDDGAHIMSVYVEPDANGFECAELSGLCAMYVRNLRGTSFRGACLYWASLQGSDFSGCNFENADLSGASLMGTLFVGTNFRNAKLGLDNLGGPTRLQGANLSNAELHGANLRGAEYDSNTKFPIGFKPKIAGMVEKDAS